MRGGAFGAPLIWSWAGRSRAGAVPAREYRPGHETRAAALIGGCVNADGAATYSAAIDIGAPPLSSCSRSVASDFKAPGVRSGEGSQPLPSSSRSA